MRRLASIAALVGAVVASVATTANPDPRGTGGRLGPVDVVAVAGARTSFTLTVEVPETAVRRGIDGFELVLSASPPGWGDTSESDVGSPLDVRLDVDGEVPSMEGADLSVADGVALTLGAPFEACAPRAPCTFVYAVELTSMSEEDRVVSLTFGAWVHMRKDLYEPVLLTLTADP